MSYMLKASDKKIGILELCTGSLKDGTPFYAYVLVKPSYLQMFNHIMLQGNFKMQNHGIVLLWGKGQEPSKELHRKVEALFLNGGIDQELLVELEEQ